MIDITVCPIILVTLQYVKFKLDDVDGIMNYSLV